MAHGNSSGGRNWGVVSSGTWSSLGSHASKLRYMEHRSCSAGGVKIPIRRCLSVGVGKGSAKMEED